MIKLPCGIVRDLLPSYVDKLTGEETNAAVNEHIQSCRDCAKILSSMQEPEPVPRQETEPHPIDYLRKVKKRSSRTLIAAVLGTLLILALILSIQAFWIGSLQDSDSLIVHTDISSVNGEPVLTAVLDPLGSNKALIPESVIEGETAVIVVKGVVPSPLHPAGTAEITVSLRSDTAQKEQIRYVYLGDRLIYEDGVEITKKAQDAFEAHTPYIGSISAAGDVARALELPALLGNWQNSLQTSREPCGWSFWFSDFYTDYDAEYLNRTMKSNSFLLLALIDNLGEVSWHYNGTDNQPHTASITLEEANREFQRLLETHPDAFGGNPPENIKHCSQSAAYIQQLMNLLQI